MLDRDKQISAFCLKLNSIQGKTTEIKLD